MTKLTRVDLPLDRYGDAIYERMYPLYVKENPVYRKGWLLEHTMELDCYRWCTENCEGEFFFTIETISETQLWLRHFYFEFENEDEAFLFKIIWG